MKINEITQPYKVTQSSPQGIEIASADGTKINLPPEKLGAIQQDPSNPNIAKLDLTSTGIQQQGKETMGQPVNGQQPTQQPQDGQLATGQPPIQGQQPANGQAPIQGQQPANGQAPQPGQPQQPQLPKVGSEIELDDNVGSTMQSETVDDVNDEDLMASGHNKDISGDPTDKFIDDVIDKKFEKNAGRSQRNVLHPDPIKESEELIAMLTIAGLR